jgi:O-methyltransferase involved in polyketide biosynthesis
MPHAELFATPMGRGLFWGFRAMGEWVAAASRSIPSMVQYLEMRHRLIEENLHDIGPDHVIEIGAGLSRRGITWAADHGVTYTEVDLPHMIEAKRRALSKASPDVLDRAEGKLTHEAQDVLGDEFAAFLTERLEGAERPVVIAEGLLGYFALPERTRIVAAVCDGLKSAGGGSFLCDMRAKEGGAAVAAAAEILKAGISVVTRGRGVREDFESHDDVRAFFADTGFDSAEPVSLASLPHLAGVKSPARVWRARV